jgi:hypothetical protein
MGLLLGDRVQIASTGLWMEYAFNGNLNDVTVHPIFRALISAQDHLMRVERGAAVPEKALQLTERFLELASQRSANRGPSEFFDDETYSDEFRELANALIELPGTLHDMNRMISVARLEIAPAVAEGLALVEPYPKGHIDPFTARSQMAESIAAAFESGDWPLLDAEVDSAIRVYAARKRNESATDEQSPSTTAGAVSTRLLGETLSMPSIPIRQVMDMRSDLREALIPLRAEIVSISNSARRDRWEPDFEKEMDALFLSRVEPHVLDLRRAIAKSRWRRLILDELTSPTTGAIAAGMLTLADAVPAAAVAAVASAFRLGRRKVEADEALRGHPFYFFHRAGLL